MDIIRTGIRIGTLLTPPLIDPVDLRVLLGYALGLSHAQLITQSERELSEEEAAVVSDMLMRRQKGEPVAYIVGEREFYGRSFAVTPDVLIPRPETELLVEVAVNALPKAACLLDLGTGSGAIAVSAACEREDIQVVATDISAAALEVAKENARRHLGENRNIVFCRGDWFAALSSPRRFDGIVSNPPYIAKRDACLLQGDLRYEPAAALTDFADGLSVFMRLIEQAPHWLKPGGQLWVEHGYDQAKQVRAWLFSRGFVSVASWRDLSGIERVSGGIFPG
ncbi:MAG: peptide chain release factor N(5)-glutamine methyltransferase [Oxalobacter formigenes]|nr:peptide chain release factor N(5)-glutamine methyltransferase [Oxalobacter formigenes]